jgi:nucleoside-diphosphate-sugar epimerase
MKKIVITGISSFIGVHLAKHFSNLGFSVIGTTSQKLSKYNSIRKKRLEEAIDSNISIEQLDITKKNELIKIIKRINPDYWIHHAGWATNYGSISYDINIGFNINVKPLEILFPLLKECNCKGIIITGSSAEYSDGDRPDKEKDPVFPAMPYGISKLNETLYAQLLALNYNLRTRVARVYIPFGKFDTPSKLIPSLIKNIKRNEQIELSPCEQKRDFLYIGDLVRGYSYLLNDLTRDKPFDIFNLCSGNSIKVKDLLLSITDHLNCSSDLLKFGSKEMRPGEALISYGSNKKAKDILGWEPEPLNNGINKLLKSV